MLFYGPSGVRKKTMIACTLRELFGKGADKVCIFRTTLIESFGDTNVFWACVAVEDRPEGDHDAVETQIGREYRAK